MRLFQHYIFSVFFLASLSASEAARSESASPEALVSEALARNVELNFYRAGIDAARGSLKTAGAIRNPEFNTQGGYKNARDDFGGTSGDGAAWSVSFNQAFEYPGRIALRKAIAQGDIQLAELYLEQFRLTLAARVRALGYNIFIAHEKLAAVREVSDRLQALTNVLAQREPAGVSAALETRVIEMHAITLQRQERETALSAKTALMQLNQLRGQPITAPLEVTGEQLVFRPTSTLPALVEAARTSAFEVRIRQAELAQQGLKVSLSKNERYPAITVGPFYSQENAADKEQQAGLGVSLPLPLWDRNAGNIETNKARKQQAQASLLAAEQDVERRVSESAAIFQAKCEELTKWQADTLQGFRETAESADRNYRLGAVPISIYVETQKQFLEAVATGFDMKKDALQVAQELEILTGQRFYRSESKPRTKQP